MIRGFAELARLMGFYAPERRQVEVTAGDQALDLRRLYLLSDAELVAMAR